MVNQCNLHLLAFKYPWILVVCNLTCEEKVYYWIGENGTEITRSEKNGYSRNRWIKLASFNDNTESNGPAFLKPSLYYFGALSTIAVFSICDFFEHLSQCPYYCTQRQCNGAVQVSGSRAKVIPSQILLDFGHQKKGANKGLSGWSHNWLTMLELVRCLVTIRTGF